MTIRLGKIQRRILGRVARGNGIALSPGEIAPMQRLIQRGLVRPEPAIGYTLTPEGRAEREELEKRGYRL